jgi:Ni/Fe-hydrogenase subunit HybB-like protein
MNSRDQWIEDLGLKKRPIQFLWGLTAIALLLVLYRYFNGVGSVTAMNDGYPKGIWLVFTLLIGSALGCGGYAMAILVYVLNKGKYHPLVRSALVTSVLGYTMGAAIILVDIGRYWNIYLIAFPNVWNFNSVMLELALCISSYVVLLWIESSPIVWEKLRHSPSKGWRGFAEWISPKMDKAYIWIVTLAMVLPTMHQSSLGSFMMIANYKVHGLWHTPFLPLLFVIGCIGVGYGMVVFEGMVSNYLFKRPIDMDMLASLSRVMVFVLLLFLGIRYVDIIVTGKLPLIWNSGWRGLYFLIEQAIFIWPLVMLMNKDKISDRGYLFRAAMLVMLAPALYRLDVWLVAFNPGSGWYYFPSFAELTIMLGVVAFQLAAYYFIVKRFPVYAGIDSTAKAH